MKETQSIVIFLAVLAGLWPLDAFMMSSSNYQINWDSVNIGGASQSSENYLSQDTIGESATGESQSSSYKLYAGYQQMEATSISISVTAVDETVSLTPNLLAITGGTANGTGAINVTTNSPAGYELKLSASTTPALKSTADSFDDYAPAGAPTPDYNWNLGSAGSLFGFTAWGADVAQAYLSAASLCDQPAGSADGTHCWNGFSGASTLTIAQSAASNDPSGTQTDVKYQAQIKSGGDQTPGSYSALVTATATTN